MLPILCYLGDDGEKNNLNYSYIAGVGARIRSVVTVCVRRLINKFGNDPFGLMLHKTSVNKSNFSAYVSLVRDHR